MTSFSECVIENAALDWLEAQGWTVVHGPDIAPGLLGAERTDYGQVVLERRLRDALARLNPELPGEALEDAFRKLTRPEGPTLEARNRALHRALVDGVTVECRQPSPLPSPSRGAGALAGYAGVQYRIARILDSTIPENNDWLAVNQFTVLENKHTRRPDIILFVNGLPLVVMELKNAADENTTVWTAFQQLQTYKYELPTLFVYNAALVVSDGTEARIGTLTAGKEWFKPWRTIQGEALAPATMPELQVMIAGVFEKGRLLDMLAHFLVFEDDGSGSLVKKMAGYHQFHAVNVALAETLRAARTRLNLAAEQPAGYAAAMQQGAAPGDRRIGVVWHTQGSGKSLSMAFYAGRIIREAAMENPTVVVLTDRNDLDDQLFGTFVTCQDLLRQPPVQAESRQHLRDLLRVESGGVVFTTIQKFLPSPQTPLPKGEGIKNSQPEDVDIHPSPLGRGDGGEGTTDSTTYRGGLDYAGLTSLARELRRTQTPAEEMLWQFLRDRRLKGVKFRRQHQYGLYILDFFCPEAQVAVECDGASHNTAEQCAQDHARDAYLHNQGVTVLRFSNTEVINDTEAVLKKIAESLTPDPSPSGRGEGSVLSYRHNIIVIADEAHRSQYDFIDGFARHMRDALPNASFIGFTGTPIEKTDANTRAVFGDYISVYDIQRAVEDKATVPIYYESRLAKLELSEAEKPRVDPEFEEVTEGEEIDRKERLKTKWAHLEALVGSEKRLKLLARDMVAHFEQRLEALDGKAMVVCMSRRICVELYREIAALRPDWIDEDDSRGVMKVVMTGSASDPLDWQQHIRNKQRREELAKRFRTAADPFRIVLVRDMWLTGFDAPSLHTMYLDKPMRGHGLMQAIARVNRVFRDKPGGLVVDYLGLAQELKQALATYTESGDTGKTAIDQEEAVAVMLEKYEVCLGLFHGLKWTTWTEGTPAERLQLLPRAQEHILAQEDGKNRVLAAVTGLSQAFALAVPHEAALRIRDDVAFFQAVRSNLAKRAEGEKKSDEELDLAVRQIVSRAVASEGVIDIFAAAGLKKPNISILSDEFLAEVRGMPHRNLAVELLRKLLTGEIKMRQKKNVVQARSFLEMLEHSLKRYQNRAIEAAQVIEELIGLARDMREAGARGEALGLTEDEVAFYDALETNDSAVKVLGDETLRAIARELVETVRRNVTIDWTMRENVRAQLRVLVKRVLRKYGYPPDKQEKATQTVLEQAALLSEEWAMA